MTESSYVQTWEVLQILGFEQDPTVFSVEDVGLSYAVFGGLKLSAVQMMNRWFRQVVSIHCIVNTGRTIASIEFEMPLQIESIKQCAAWVTWHLQQQWPAEQKYVLSESKLIALGLQHQSTLPWIRKQAAHAARPHCIVKRDWLRLALNELSAALSGVEDSVEVQLHFDGTVLVVVCQRERIVCPASGDAWPNHYVIAAQHLRKLPKRLMIDMPCVEIWEGCLGIDRYRYEGVRELED